VKKSFPKQVGKHAPARVIEGIKGEVNKYLKRERNKRLPEGTDFWDFDCRVGADSESAKESHAAALGKDIDSAATLEGDSIYIEILAKARKREKKG